MGTSTPVSGQGILGSTTSTTITIISTYLNVPLFHDTPHIKIPDEWVREMHIIPLVWKKVTES